MTTRRAALLSQLYAAILEATDDVSSIRNMVGVPPAPERFPEWVEQKAKWERGQWSDPTGFKFRFMDDAQDAWTMVSSEGLLARIGRLAEEVSRDFHWKVERIPVWLVCGAPIPPHVPINVDFREMRPLHAPLQPFDSGPVGPPLVTDTTSRLVLTLDPALSPEEVATLWSWARGMVAGPDSQRIRPIEHRAARLLQFTFERVGENIWPGWSKWLNQWNVENPDLAYQGLNAAKVFRRAVQSAFKRLSVMGWTEGSDHNSENSAWALDEEGQVKPWKESP